MTKIQSAAVPAVFVLLTSIGLGYGALAPQSRPGEDEPKPEPKPPIGFEAPESAETQPLAAYRTDFVKRRDILIVEVLAPLPGLPISGRYLVRRDGKLGLGFYGDVEVADMTVPMVKERIAGHLRGFASDEALGLKPGADPKNSDRIYIGNAGAASDAAADGDQPCYLLGEFEKLGPAPATGRETVLDAVNWAGGLTPRANPKDLLLVRGSSGERPRYFPINFDAIISADDDAKNYILQPGDRLIAAPKRSGQQAEEPELGPVPARSPTPRAAVPQPPTDESRRSEIERRLEKIEAQLAEILKRLDDR